MRLPQLSSLFGLVRRKDKLSGRIWYGHRGSVFLSLKDFKHNAEMQEKKLRRMKKHNRIFQKYCTSKLSTGHFR